MTEREILGLPFYLLMFPIYVAADLGGRFRDELERARLRRAYRDELERTRREFARANNSDWRSQHDAL